jgi:hypothetical protein
MTYANRGKSMWPVIRSILAVIAGFVVASVIMMINETANARVFYPDFARQAEAKDKEITQQAVQQGVDANSSEVLKQRREAVREILANAPLGALLVVVFGWAISSVAGGFFAAWIVGRSPITHGVVLGVLLTLAGIANNLMIPPPAWFWVLTIVVFLPATFMGARLAPTRAASPTATTVPIT